MRVLFVSSPLLGHVFPMAPLALAMRAAGHDVLVATGGEALAAGGSGLPVEDVAPAVRMGTIGLGVALRHPVAARAEAAGAAGTAFVSRLFGTMNERIADDVAALVHRWEPDLVVHEPLAVAGALAAARHGVPAVVHDFSLFDGLELARATAARMGHRLRDPAAVLRIAPPSLGQPDGIPMRYVPYGGDAPVPESLSTPPERPRVLVSRSTVAGPGGGRFMAAVAAAAGEVDAEFVLVRPPARLTRTRLPGNVRWVGWVPIPAVLPTCSAVIHHGAAGTLLAAFAAGLPQLAEPGAGDRAHHARRLVTRGAGLAATAREVTPGLLTRLLTDPGYRRAANEVRDELAAMPAPEELVVSLTSPARRR